MIFDVTNGRDVTKASAISVNDEPCGCGAAPASPTRVASRLE